jgi:hypothetical protein
VEDKLTELQLAELRKKLSIMSVTAVINAYRSAYFQCKLEGDKLPSARAIQTLVQAWREIRRWSNGSESRGSKRFNFNGTRHVLSSGP